MKSLNEDIKTGNFKQAYLLYGEEEYLKRRYKNQFRAAIVQSDDTMNFTAFEGKSMDVQAVIDQAETMPFFAKRRLILVEQSGLFKSAAGGELAEYLPRMPRETVMLFVENEVDKRSRLYKAVKQAGRIVELGRQDEGTLRSWVLSVLKKEQKSITREALSLFLEKAGDDMENIASELEKLLCYTKDAPGIETRHVEEICTVTTESRIFEMVRAVAGKQRKRALELYYDLLALKEPPMRILFLLARQFNQMLQVKDLREQGLDSAGIAQRAGIAPFIAKRILSQAGGFSLEELRRIVRDCVETEEAVKTGRLGDRLALEMLIVKYTA